MIMTLVPNGIRVLLPCGMTTASISRVVMASERSEELMDERSYSPAAAGSEAAATASGRPGLR
jgi:hypothetical protein